MKKYKLTLTTQTTFSEEDKFHIRDKFDTLSMILDSYNGGEIREGEYYFRYSYERTDKIFIENDNEKEMDEQHIRYGKYESVKDGYSCFTLGVYNNNGEYFDSFDIMFVVKPEEEDEFLDELFKKMIEYSLINDYRFNQTEIKKVYE